MSQQAERRVGTVIGGKWRVDALLGSGSMAAVYGVTHRNGARAALKILHPTLCIDPSVCERFLGEGYLANSVKHPGIVRVLDDGITDDGCVFLTMDLLEGGTLEEHRQKRHNRIPLLETLDLSDKLMDCLIAVHAAGIIHRDLKPQNVFVCDDGTLKLLDFGVARVFDRTSQSKLSMFGLVLGTPSFMSPEQALGSRDKVDHRSDIWSLGATMFTALSGETVHLGANVQAKLLAAATMKARSITMVMPDLPEPIAHAIDMSLRFKKEDRWQSVDAMRRTIREARQQLGLGRHQSIVPPEYDMPLEQYALHSYATPASHSGPSGGELSEDDLVEGSIITASAELNQTAETGTFIGIGDRDGKLASIIGNDGSVPPHRLSTSTQPMRAPSVSPAAVERSASTAPVPSASFHPAARLGSIPGPRHGSGVDFAQATPQEQSIPAYGGTVNRNLELQFGADDSVSDIDPALVGGRRTGSVAVWLFAAVLAATALGGLAFFALMETSSSKPLGNSAPPLTTGTLPSATSAPSSPIVVPTGAGTTTIEFSANPALPPSMPSTPTSKPSAGAAGAKGWNPMVRPQALPGNQPPAVSQPRPRPRPDGADSKPADPKPADPKPLTLDPPKPAPINDPFATPE